MTDIEVSRATGLHLIAYAETPTRGGELQLAGADAITDSNRDLADHVRPHIGKRQAVTLSRLHCR